MEKKHLQDTQSPRPFEQLAQGNSGLLRDYEVASLLRVSVATVRRWRFWGRGPRCMKIGALVRYRQEDVEGWLESCPQRGEEVA